MNCRGTILNPKIDKNKLYRFLRKALANGAGQNHPLRAEWFAWGHWVYNSSLYVKATPLLGNLDNFRGTGEIARRNHLILYREEVHGGFIR